MDSFINILVKQKFQKLLDWRSTTQRDLYSIKLSKNLLYEMLTVMKMWEELKKSFATFDFSGERIYNNFIDAHKYVFTRRRQIQTEIILPSIDNLYIEVNELPYLNFASLRKRSQEACYGLSSQIEEIEFAYYFYTSACELLYGWSALGLTGLREEDAFLQICTAKWDGIDYDSLECLIEAFGKTVAFFYKPLDNI